MLIDFFFTLKAAKIPVSIKEYLILLEGLNKNVIEPSIDEFYFFRARLWSRMNNITTSSIRLSVPISMA